ncbi:MAG TPA: hypothetical protein VN039_06965 [Nitrospira sp.]|nr:hypothetical protein [Nitrospira sp.]
MRRQFRFRVSGHMRVGEDLVAFTRVVRASSQERAIQAVKFFVPREPRYEKFRVVFLDDTIKAQLS